MSHVPNNLPKPDYVVLEFAAFAVGHILKTEKERWDYLDQLVAKRAHLKTRLARNLHRTGKITDSDLQLAYTEIDDELAMYDNSPTVESRHEIINMMRGMINRLHKAAQISRQQREDKTCHRILPTNLNPLTI